MYLLQTLKIHTQFAALLFLPGRSLLGLLDTLQPDVGGFLVSVLSVFVTPFDKPSSLNSHESKYIIYIHIGAYRIDPMRQEIYYGS